MDTMAHKEWCLRPGERLNTNEYLRSKNGLFYAVMQEDGNFVTYRGDWWESGQNTSMWNLFGLGRVRSLLSGLQSGHGIDSLSRHVQTLQAIRALTHAAAFFSAVRRIENWMLENTKNEVAMLIAEDTDEVKETIHYLHQAYTDQTVKVVGAF
jgi:hypothetical protein